MVYDLKDDETVVLCQQGDYTYILNDTVYMLRLENENIHIRSIKIIQHIYLYIGAIIVLSQIMCIFLYATIEYYRLNIASMLLNVLSLIKTVTSLKLPKKIAFLNEFLYLFGISLTDNLLYIVIMNVI